MALFKEEYMFDRKNLRMTATCAFGLEAAVKRELRDMGCEIYKVEDGKVSFKGSVNDIARTNIRIRTADRILLKIDEFCCSDFETLYQRVKGFAWEEILSMEAYFPVQCSTINSKLKSEPACQATVKKAIVERLCDFYQVDYLPETGERYKIRINLFNDNAFISIDTSGEGLHKRGYRKEGVRAPLKETLAAGLVSLSFWKKDRILVDPFCGSGTIAIEAAMMGANIAPGLNRTFDSQSWPLIPQKIWVEEKKKAYTDIDFDAELNIYASDIDESAVASAKHNAEEAGVAEFINIHTAAISELQSEGDNGIIITNPPYGERLATKEELNEIYESLFKFMNENTYWSLFAISSDESFEDSVMKRKADRCRKLYNGGIKTYYYQFHGKKSLNNQ